MSSCSASSSLCLFSTASPRRNRGVFQDVKKPSGKQRVFTCFASKKKPQLSFMDQILDYIEGGPKLRKWYGAPDLLPKDGNELEEDEETEEEIRDAVLISDGDNEIGQMIILSLIVKKVRVKALVKDKRSSMEAFGTYVEPVPKDTKDKTFLKKALRGVRAVICPNEGFVSNVEDWKGIEHVILLSQLSVYSGSTGIQAVMNSNAMKLMEREENLLKLSGIPYTIIRTGALKNTPGGEQGFSFEEGCAAKGSISKEDAAFICIEALGNVPPQGFIIEVVNGSEKISNWKECFSSLMNKSKNQPL